MTSKQLALMQDIGSVVFLLCLVLGALHLIAGLIRPRLVWRKGRGGVVLVSLAAWLFGLVTYGGIIAYTHSHPNGPHALKGYLDDYFAEQCAQGADLPACKQDGTADATQPPAATP
jgi:hypothetical protein